jgi:hypothetical protein
LLNEQDEDEDLSMQHMLLSVSWQRVVLAKGDGEDTTTKTMDGMTSRLI